MSTKSKNNSSNSQTFGHAVVIGSSIAGLTAARVLVDRFDRVTIVERDHLPASPEHRRGVPQTRHAHTLPLRAQEMLEQQFPGLSKELFSNGAVAINGGSEMAFFIAGKWHEVRHQASLISLACSRPLLDSTIYHRLRAHPRVSVIQEQEVIGLETDNRRERVTGVRLRSRQGLFRKESGFLAADLVLDASGRMSHAPDWLAGLGFSPPRQTTVNAFAGYASRIYRRPAGFDTAWKTLYIRPTPPQGSRGGLIIPIEGNRWHVTLIGMAGDYPPTGDADFLEFARSLPVPQLYEAIREAEPLSKPSGYRWTQNRVNHYDKLPRYLEGFLVAGDAAYILNPVYAQGITAALLGSQALAQTIEAQRDQDDLLGLASAFQSELRQAVASAWHLATREDRRWPATEVTKEVEPRQRRSPRLRLSSAAIPTR
jgi:2-polyprenyl-6-methoxyphenol hydroxylase-like FAD-dependent oxidoreductase